MRLLAEQSLAGARAEAETTRATVRAAEADNIRRLTELRGGFDMATEQVRTLLSREQGELRLALAEGQRLSGERIGAQFETTRTMVEAKLKEIREGNEAKLAEIQKTVNEQLHEAVEKQMKTSFERVIDRLVPEMARGQGVYMQKYKDGGLTDATGFVWKEGLKDENGRLFTPSDLKEWRGARAQAGRP